MKIKKFANFFCTGFGVGLFPFMPGTLASFVILPIVWLIKSENSQIIYFFCILSYFFVSFIFLKIILVNEVDKDPKYIVCDEYLGQSIAIFCCNQILLDYLIAFILFRLFDIIKPFPINYFDKMKNVTGLLMDDVVAGLIVALIFFFYYAN